MAYDGSTRPDRRCALCRQISAVAAQIRDMHGKLRLTGQSQSPLHSYPPKRGSRAALQLDTVNLRGSPRKR